MAQTNFTPILLYASSTAAAVPLAANLTNSATGSEIAINVADKNLFFKDSTNAVNTVPIRQSSTSSNGWLSSTDWNTFNGKAPSVTFTTGYVPFGQGTTTLNQSSNLFFSGTNLGIGLVNGTSKLEVAGTGANNAGARATYEGTIKINEAGSFSLQTTGGLEFKGSVFGSGYGSKIFSTDSGSLLFGNRANSATWIERVRLVSSGEFLVGCTGLPAATRALGFAAKEASTGGIQIYQVGSNTDWAINSTSGSIANFYSDNGSALVFAGSISVNSNITTYGSVSDYRLKENVTPVTNALAVIDKLNPVDFTWKDSDVKGQSFIAHELQAVFPSAVMGEKDAVKKDGKPDYQNIDTSYLIATLVAAVKELKAELDLLKAK